MRILVVDDEQEICNYIAEMSEWADIGCTVAASAANGAEALELARKERPDILLTDIRMPVMNGIELAETLRKEFPELPIIFLSAYNEFDYAKKAIRLGAIDFITKPFVATDLVWAVKQVQLQQQLEWRHHEEFFSLFSQGDEKDEEKRRWLEEHHYQDEAFILLYAELDTMAGTTDNRRAFRDRSIFPAVMPALERYAASCWTLETHAGLYVLMRSGILSCSSLQNHAIELAKQMADEAAITDELSLSVGISQEEDSLLSLPDAIGQIASCMEYRMLLGKRSVIAYDAIKTIISGKEQEVNFSINRIADFLRTGNLNGITDALMDVYRRMLTVGAGKQEIQHFCISLVERTEGVMEEFGMNPESRTRMHIREKILKSVILTDMMRELEQFLLSSAGLIGELIDQAPKRIVAETKRMIEQDFAEEMSLQAVAQQLKVNYSYLSRVIKKETGHNFSDLLWMTRIEAAKSRLLKEDLKAYEVAYAVGFKNYAHFSLLFKKNVGVSPSTYKLQSSIQQDMR